MAISSQIDTQFQRHRALVFTILLTAVLLVFYWQPLTGRVAFYQNDISYYFEPICGYIGDRLQHGQLPLWNPFSYCGMSQVDMPSPNFCYLPNFIFAFLPFSQSLAILLILHQAIAGLGTSLLVSRWHWRTSGGVLAAIAVALCGYMFASQTNYTLVMSAAWIPVSMWAFDRLAMDKYMPANLALASLTAASLMLSGRPEISLPGTALLIVYASVRVWQRKTEAQPNKADRFRRLGLIATALAIGLLIASPVVLPTSEWAALSRRASGLPTREVLLWSANWYDFVCILLSHPLGDLSIYNTTSALVASRPGQHPYISSFYLGPVVSTYAIWGILSAGSRTRWIALGTLIIASLLALGGNTPVVPSLLSALPVLGLLRYPVKLMFFVCLAWSILAARGLSAGIDSKLSSRHITVTAVLAFAGVSAGCFFLLTRQALPVFPAALVAESVRDLASSLFAHELVATSAIVLLVSALQGLLIRGVVRQSIIVPAMIALSTIMQMQSATKYERHYVPEDLRKQGSILAGRLRSLPNHENSQRSLLVMFFDELPPADYFITSKPTAAASERYCRDVLQPDSNMSARLASSWGYEATVTAAYEKYFFAVMEACSQSQLIDTASYRLRFAPLYRFCRLSATQFVITTSHVLGPKGVPGAPVPIMSPQLFDLVATDRTLNINIYHVRKGSPRAYFAENWRCLNSEKNGQKLFDQWSGSYDPADDPILQPVIEHGEPPQNLASSRSHASSADHEHLLLKEDSPEHLSIAITASKPGYLILCDTFYPGWTATVDSVSAPIYRANLFYRAVYVTAGSHQVEFTYCPQSFIAGLILSLVGALVLSIACLSGTRSWKRQSK